jgi:teichuronic acid biosynthesis glycosyltransferase TuaG
MQPKVSIVMQPKVSIVMPCFCASKTIEASILSVLSQTMSNWELIIVDDCSQDNSVSIAEKWTRTDKRIRIIKLKENIGPAEARNIGTNAAEGNFIAFLDSDDIWMPSKLETQLSAMNFHQAPFSCTSYKVQKNRSITRFINVPKVITSNLMLRGSVIGCSTVMYDASVLGKIHFTDLTSLYASDLDKCKNIRILHEDYALWLDILLQELPSGSKINCLGVQKCLAIYNESSSSFSSSKYKAAKSQWIIYRKHLKLKLVSSVFYFFLYTLNGFYRRILSKYDNK